MAQTPPLVLPRGVPAANVSPDSPPAGSSVRVQSGAVQLRDFHRAGRMWRELYGLVGARNTTDMAWLARLQWFRSRSKSFWADHPLLPGSGILPNGPGEENLLRSAAMDTDTDADGVVDDFEDHAGAATASLDAGVGAQKIAVSAASAGSFWVAQYILRVFPGDEIYLSADVKVGSLSGDASGLIRVDYYDSSGNLLAFDQTTFSNTAFARSGIAATAPADCSYVGFRCPMLFCAASGGGTIWARDARVLRGVADPATWANPHVDGAGQTGDVLSTAGWPASTTVMRAGDVFRVGGSGDSEAAAETDEVLRSMKVLADVDSDGSGAADVPIDPSIFAGVTVPDGAALRLRGVRLKAYVVEANLQGPSSMVDKWGGLSATYAEVLA
jgi:hypothetical protein